MLKTFLADQNLNKNKNYFTSNRRKTTFGILFQSCGLKVAEFPNSSFNNEEVLV